MNTQDIVLAHTGAKVYAAPQLVELDLNETESGVCKKNCEDWEACS